MIRPATAADIWRIIEIRDAAGDNALSDPGAVTAAQAAGLVANDAMWVWQEPGSRVTGFAGVDLHHGSIWALLVAPGHDGKGIGRALLEAACDALRAAGHRRARLTLAPGSRAERHYRAAGWIAAGVCGKGPPVFERTL